jgi:hypothetical protein
MGEGGHAVRGQLFGAIGMTEGKRQTVRSKLPRAIQRSIQDKISGWRGNEHEGLVPSIGFSPRVQALLPKFARPGLDFKKSASHLP